MGTLGLAESGWVRVLSVIAWASSVRAARSSCRSGLAWGPSRENRNLRRASTVEAVSGSAGRSPRESARTPSPTT